jgi:hypothetical protein
MTFVIAALVILLTFALGGLLAFLFTRLDRAVDMNKIAIDTQDRGYNTAVTMGYQIDTLAPPNEQVREARKQAAIQAAALPRGANMRIGWSANPGGKSASVGVPHDPWTGAKIAEFHGWDGARDGLPAAGVVAAPAAPAAVAVAAGPVELVPGKDYAVIEITDAMSPDEVRKARIANSKAKSAALKAAKATEGGVAAATTGAAAVAAAPAAAVPLGIESPNLIVITDDMPADEVRKARIANSKAKSAFNKALKAAGIDPATVELDDAGNVIMPQGAVAAASPVTAGAAATPAAATGPLDLAALGIAPPQMTVLSDDLSPDETRQARIANSKAKSAFNKALKAAGIDPADVEVGDDGQVTLKSGAVAAPTAAAAQAAAPAAAPATAVPPAGTVDFAALGITPPDLIEITDDMSPDAVRQARIANSKAKSVFNKALKAAGIDPKTVEL